MTIPDPVVELSTRAIPSLRASLNRLALLANESTGQARFARDDHFGFMAITFHAKQLEHAKAVLKLGGHPDAALVARSMLEGWWQLKWAHGDAQARAERWRAFSLVYDWRSIQDAKAAGVDVPMAREEQTEARLAGVRERFLNRKARDAIAQGRPLPADPFQSTWHGKQLRQLVEEIGELALYAGAYEEFSDRHHWAPAGVGRGIQLNGHIIRYDGQNSPSTARTIVIAFQCLYETAILLNDHLALGFQERLRELERRFLAEDGVIRAGGVPEFDDPAPD